MTHWYHKTNQGTTYKAFTPIRARTHSIFSPMNIISNSLVYLKTWTTLKILVKRRLISSSPKVSENMETTPLTRNVLTSLAFVSLFLNLGSLLMLLPDSKCQVITGIYSKKQYIPMIRVWAKSICIKPWLLTFSYLNFVNKKMGIKTVPTSQVCNED